MSNKKIWFITGASCGMGVDFAKVARALIMIGSQEPPPGRELRLANPVILRGGR